MQYVEELDAARERASVLEDSIGNQIPEKMNKKIYVLSVIAAIFQPLGFVSGLLGINVGGIPWAENINGFLLTALCIGAIVGFEIVLFEFWNGFSRYDQRRPDAGEYSWLIPNLM